ncbi:MAG: hypothetical protein KDK45_25080, partial [Leptospiraceae bacterium]|nr:hypothetical protein [Leptospiraceae bacterium]
MGEFDKTKKAIGIGKMDDKDREQMFNKFKSAGGEVVKDKKPEEDPSQKNRSKNRPSTGSSGKGTGGSVARRSSGTTSNRSKQSETSSPYILPSGKKEKSQQEIEAQMGNFLNRLIIKFKCWAGKVTSFGNSDLLAEFISELNLECKNSLLEMKMAGLDIMADPGVGKKIATELDKINPLYIELIGKAHKLYDSSEFESISGTYNSNQNFSVPIDRAAPSVYSLYRKIYYLYSFQGTYRKGIILAYDLLQKIEKKPAIIYTTKKKRISAAINTIFDRMFPKLYLVILRNESKNIPMVSFYMENLLGIIDEEKPGKRKPGDPLPISSNEEEIENVEEGEEEEEVEENEEDFSSVPSELKLGLKFMSEQTVEDLKQKYDPRNE